MLACLLLRAKDIVLTNLFYAVYAISSLDTEGSLRHRTQTMQFVGTVSPPVSRGWVGWGAGGLCDTPLCCFYAVYAVYAISSLDTGVPLRHRTRQRRRTHQGDKKVRQDGAREL